MDSLTQIVLGAAAGEAVLGKKIGNRAMFWGAVGGTIPDLDVLGKFFLSNIDNLAFHRGISHSIIFSLFGAIVFGWLVSYIYKSYYHKWIAIFSKAMAALLIGFTMDYVFKRIFPGNYFPTIMLGIGIAVVLYFNIKKRYFSETWVAPEASVRDWQWLFFWSLFTHPVLDCFTMYGTQLFAPFANTRVAWSTISVVDPLYTVPFIICLLVASRRAKESNKRRFWNYLGIGLSSAYLLFTVFNKQRVNQVFADALASQNIEVERFVTNPTIFNNIVWGGAAETKDSFYLGQYSLFDEVPLTFTKVAKNHDLLKNLDTDPTIKTLRWFSDNYFTVNQVGKQYQVNDLRFGTFSGEGSSPDDFVFKFMLTDKGEEGYYMEEAKGGPPEGKEDAILTNIWTRMKGKKQQE